MKILIKDNPENIGINIDKDFLENMIIYVSIRTFLKISISISKRTFLVKKSNFLKQICEFFMLFDGISISYFSKY